MADLGIYNPFGKEWEEDQMKCTKEELVKKLKRAITLNHFFANESMGNDTCACGNPVVPEMGVCKECM